MLKMSLTVKRSRLSPNSPMRAPLEFAPPAPRVTIASANSSALVSLKISTSPKRTWPSVASNSSRLACVKRSWMPVSSMAFALPPMVT